MGKTVFIPLTDELLFEHPERILGPVIPFSQQARRTVADLASLSSRTPSVGFKTILESTGANKASRSKPSKASKPRGRALH